jgi:microcystin-dependent protein
MPYTADGYYYIDDLDQPADMGAHSAADANAAQAVMDAHEAAPDPHPGYATDADLSSHVAAADPHPGYQKESEKGAANGYASLDATVKVPIAQVPTGITGSTAALGNHNHDGVYAPASSGVPTGFIGEWPTLTPPAGWLLCNGAAVSRTTYAALFATCGVQFGVGDGSTTFNLPDYRQRTGAGYDASAAEFNAVGKTNPLSAKTHALTPAEMPAHSHEYYPGGTRNLAGWLDGGTQDPSKTTGGKLFDWLGARTQDTGSGAAHNNLPPYITISRIIKT